MDQWLAWERSVAQYEEASKVKLDDGVKCATVARWCPHDIQHFIRNFPNDVMSSYPELREAIQTFITR
eukprot:11845455-Heterocapsa_arctica.AAC.1